MENKNTTRGASIDSEKNIDAWLRKEVKKLKGFYIKMQTDFEGGLPDRQVLLPGGFSVFIELKTKGEEARALQKFQHARLRRLGQTVLIIDTRQKAKAFLAAYRTALIL